MEEYDLRYAYGQERYVCDQLASQPVVKMKGVIGEQNFHVTQEPGSDLWSLHITFVAWRVGKGPVRKEKLEVYKKGFAYNEASMYISNIQELSVIKIRARTSDEKYFDEHCALLEEYIDQDTSDKELQEHLLNVKAEIEGDQRREEQKKRDRQSVTYPHDVLGEFVFDSDLERYVTQITWNDKKVNLEFYADDPDFSKRTAKVCIDHAYKLYQKSDTWNRHIFDCIVEEYLEEINEGWLDEDKEDLTAEELEKRIELSSILVGEDGSFEFSYDDDGLLGGHSIIVTGSLLEGVKEACMMG